MENEMKDERVMQNITKSLANAAIFVEAVLLLKIVYEIFSGTATLRATGFDVGLFIGMNAVIYITLYRAKTLQTPKTILGKKLTTETTEIAKKERILKSYIPESLIAAAGLSLGSYLSSGSSGFLPTLIIYIFYFVFYLILTYFWSEHEIKRYNEDFEIE